MLSAFTIGAAASKNDNEVSPVILAISLNKASDVKGPVAIIVNVSSILVNSCSTTSIFGLFLILSVTHF